MVVDTMRLRVTSVRPEARGIVGLTLASVDGSDLPAFEAGAHVDVHLAGGLCRQYSLIGDAGGVQYEIAVKREPQSKGGSARMHELKPGDELTVGRPRNNFPVMPRASYHLLFAGGIGVTPLFCMARSFVRRRLPFHLHYFASSDDQVAFRDELTSPAMSDHVTLHLGFGPDEVSLTATDALVRPVAGTHLYICGPSPFMDCVRNVAARTLPEAAIHIEHFTHVPAADGREFEVVLARKGLTLTVPADCSILDALTQNSVDVDFACQKGICGTCIVGLLEGQAEHLDSFLTAEERQENRSIAICVSRAKTGRLKLDL